MHITPETTLNNKRHRVEFRGCLCNEKREKQFVVSLTTFTDMPARGLGKAISLIYVSSNSVVTSCQTRMMLLPIEEKTMRSAVIKAKKRLALFKSQMVLAKDIFPKGYICAHK